MTALEIVEKYLKDNGFEGLTDNETDECQCAIKDLFEWCDRSECWVNCIPIKKLGPDYQEEDD